MVETLPFPKPTTTPNTTPPAESPRPRSTAELDAAAERRRRSLIDSGAL